MNITGPKVVHRWVWFLAGLLFLSGSGLAAQPKIHFVTSQTNGWVWLEGEGDTNQVFTLQSSTNLFDWEAVAVLFSQRAGEREAGKSKFEYSDPRARFLSRRYYRIAAKAPDATNDWRNQSTTLGDEFVCSNQQGVAELRWIKFLILPSQPDRVYYQDSTKYLFHYDFAKERLAPFRQLSLQEFDAISLRTNNQQAVLGAVLFQSVAPGYLGLAPDEYAIQFVGLDPYPPERIREWFELVRSTVIGAPGTKALYFPTFEQSVAAHANEAYFAENGITVDSLDRWTHGNQVYSPGWALGRLNFIHAAEIAAAYADGRLQPQDILLTDGVPAEVPFVAGIITLAPATPNSHVAILASSYGIPFVFLSVTNDVARAQQMVSRKLLLQATSTGYSSRIELIDAEGLFDALTEAQILALKTPPPISIQPKQRFGAYAAPTDSLGPADVRFFGGKAANYGYLRRAVSSNSPPAIAFAFDLWDDFMDQQLASGKTLRTEIASRLQPYTNYPPDMFSLKTTLAAIRDLITKTAFFTPAQQQAVISALTLPIFDPLKNIRFRSSSNAEDSQIFTAAGLYDSFSGCLADDLDGDAVGPCRCDSAELKERGVFRAIQKVYASFYNDNAFLERLRHRIDETQVGMALLVHHSTPDEQELANGVATLTVTRSQAGSDFRLSIIGDLVTQAGAVSVTNPQSEAAPERVHVTDYSYGASLSIEARSSLVPLGGYVLEWQAEYQKLVTLLEQVTRAFSTSQPDKQKFILDFEYKKVPPGSLIVKQVRELPLADTNRVAPFLIGNSMSHRIIQGEGASVFTYHRLKCELLLECGSLQLTASNLANGLYFDAQFNFLNETRIETLSGDPVTWPKPVHTVTNNGSYWIQVQDSWTFGTGADQRTFTLTSLIPNNRTVANPFVTQQDINKSLTVTYATPVIDPLNPTFLITNESVSLTRWQAPGGSIIATNYGLLAGIADIDPEKAKKIETGGYLRSGSDLVPFPSDPPDWIIKTYPLGFFDEIKITGLISQPILLRSIYGQSACPAHHNWGAWYVFEPRLDPGLSPQQRDELAAANIQLLYVQIPPYWGGEQVLNILGLDGKFRPW